MEFSFSRLLLFCLQALWALAAAADVPAARGRPAGCATRCGDVDVPYPFGLEPRCAINDGFWLNCTTPVGHATPTLQYINVEVTKISVEDGKAWLKTWMSRQCYNQSTNQVFQNNAWIGFAGSPYVLSADDNMVIVLGCRSMAYMLSDAYIIGCMSTCHEDVPLRNGSCSGNAGCCQADLPRGVQYYQGFFNDFYNTSEIWRRTPCNYVTVMESAAFTFSTTYLTSTVFYDTEDGRTPVVMEWGIARQTCEQAKINKTTPYACVSNHSDCVDNDYAGYRCRERRKLHRIKERYFRQHGGLLLFEEMKSQQGVAFKIFSEEELQQATNKFDEQQVLGHGGHGTVYKGVLKSDTEIAVKRCMTIDEQQKKEFGKEMLILSQINHRNIVKLLGCCLEVEVPILVYEFIPNGTLFDLIHQNHSRYISLDTRLRIAYESAEALAYLHSCASPPILHGDVKSTNILLDGDYTAKVSDFGASILAPNDKSQFVTVVQGTCGYLDPEYMQTYQLTDKSDVYSFGVVLLELLTRKKAFNLEGPEHDRSLSMRFLYAMKENKLEDILDDQIKNSENTEYLEEIADLARRCLEMSGMNRPSMKEVADKLDRLRKIIKHPWAHENPEELDSLLGEPSTVTSTSTTGNFSIAKKAAMGLESGR
ncbi:Wall-associated receptor kinase 3 [Dichanthelium oligosanthes]|uniref:Wall-associated receptor kinase 3 n=1 Tax=Dichanthelium oligosanthes TaxID=888268 RepID=A0A1E5UVP4_9POAL|nr:Wall-associated receptor kinase 3 [Dichanthelium oligosanthes]